MRENDIFNLYDEYVMPTYHKTRLALARGKGIYVWDESGKKYLDFFPGWAVSGIGHCHPRVVKAIKKQSGTFIHIANNYYHAPQALLAKKLVESAFPGKVFFCNSGAEANEAAFKLARKWGNPERNEIISMERAFHGRTIATIAAGQRRLQEGFEPLPGGFSHVPFSDIAALKKAVGPKTVAIVLEPIQGEGGVRVASTEYLKAVRALCDEKKVLLIFDEVQSGMGRTGDLFAFQTLGVEPDIVTLSKALGSGFPIGATIAKRSIADTLQPGTHGSTFAGSPLACAAALATLEAIEEEKLLENARTMGAYLRKKLEELKKKHAIITAVRGVGLMFGVECTRDCKDVYERCLQQGLLINCTQGSVLRIMPPLIIKKREIDVAIRILDSVLATA